MDISHELDIIIKAIESGKHTGFTLCLLRWRKARLEDMIP